jgi:O-antigen/teichoic acid export membrane protein
MSSVPKLTGVPDSVLDDRLDTPEAGTAAVRGVALRVGGYGLGALLGLASSALLFHHLGVDDGGRFVTVQSLALLAAGITDAGLTSIGVREWATREGEDRRTVMRDLLGLRILLTGSGVLGAILFAVLAGYPRALVVGTAIMGVAVFCGALQHALGVGMAADLRQGWITAVDLLRQAVTAAAVIGLVLLGARLVPFFWAQAVGGAAGVVGLVLVVRRSIPLRPAFRRERWAELVRDTLPYALAAAVSVLYYRLAIIIMSLTATSAETGYFGAGFRGVEVLIGVPALAGGVIFPVMARAAVTDRQRLAFVLGRTLDAALPAGVGVALLLGVGAPVVIDVVAGPSFAGAYDVLRIQGLGLLVSFMGMGLGFTLLAMRAHTAVLVANLLALATSAVLVPLLSASGGGAVGAAVATTIAETVLVGSMAIGVRRAGLPLRMDPGLAMRVGVATALGLAPAALTGIPLAPRTIVCGAVFAGVLIALKALPPELRDHLPKAFR